MSTDGFPRLWALNHRRARASPSVSSRTFKLWARASQPTMTFYVPYHSSGFACIALNVCARDLADGLGQMVHARRPSLARRSDA